MASENEERIRLKAEARLRAENPQARIIHELVLEQGVTRIDLAAIGDEQITLVEIKSEKDTFARLKAQLSRAFTMAADVWLVINEKHTQEIDQLFLSWHGKHAPAQYDPTFSSICRDRLKVLIETAESDKLKTFNRPYNGVKLLDGRTIFDLLWAEEMAAVLKRLMLIRDIKKHPPRREMTLIAIENLPLATIRRVVCYELRRRKFARADLPDKD